MYNLQLSPEQLEIRDTVREFVARKIKPAALKPARLEAAEQPLLADLLEEASQLGLRALALSEAAGGAGADNLTCCIVSEELAAGDPDIAAVLGETWMLAQVLFDQLMTPGQRDRFLPAFLEDARYHIARAREEPDCDGSLGIHYHRPEQNDLRFATTGIRNEDGWVLNGLKHEVANASVARLFVVEAATSGGTSAILVPCDTPGLTVHENGAHMRRRRHGACGAISLKDCRVPVENLLGPEGQSKLGPEIARGMAQHLAMQLGIGRAAYEAALDYAQMRLQGGRRIIEHQAIGAKLADVATRLAVARSIIWQAAWASDHPEAFADRSLPDLPLASVAKVFASETVYHASKDAAECFGAMGVMRDMPLQKYVHDALICLHSGEANTDTRLRIAEAIAGHRRPPPLIPPPLAGEGRVGGVVAAE
jgi:alkylation response protein AidB-like acyl-CoA dehydrogenase